MALATYTQIADAIVVRLAQVEGTGIVHNRQRNLIMPAVFKAACVNSSTGLVASWMVSRKQRTDTQSSNISNTILHTFYLRGYYGMEDAKETEITFNKIVDNVCEAFRPQGSLDGIVELILPVQVLDIDYRELHGVLCHFAECTLTVQEYISE